MPGSERREVKSDIKWYNIYYYTWPFVFFVASFWRTTDGGNGGAHTTVVGGAWWWCGG